VFLITHPHLDSVGWVTGRAFQTVKSPAPTLHFEPRMYKLHKCRKLTSSTKIYASRGWQWCYTHDTRYRNWRHYSTPFFWRKFLVHVSFISLTGFVWY